MLSTLITHLVVFFVHALSLKLAVSAVSAQPAAQNSYSRALKLSAGFVLLSFLLGVLTMKLIAWPLYAVIWCVVIMKTYRLSLTRSVGVALVQTVASWALGWLIGKLLGLPAAGLLG